MADRLGYVIVPRNREGMVGQMAGDANPDDLLFFAFTPQEVAAAADVMRAFQDAFGFDADGLRVEQLVDTRYAGLAEDIARARARQADTPLEREAASRIADALAASLQYGSYAEFAFD